MARWKSPRTRAPSRGTCRKTTPHIAITPGAHHFITAHMEPAAFDMFVQQHIAQLPSSFGNGYAMSSRLRSQGQTFLLATSVCRSGQWLLTVHLPEEKP